MPRPKGWGSMGTVPRVSSIGRLSRRMLVVPFREREAMNSYLDVSGR